MITANADDFDMFVQSRQFDATQHTTADSYAFQQEASLTSGSMSTAATGNTNTGDMVSALTLLAAVKGHRSKRNELTSAELPY